MVVFIRHRNQLTRGSHEITRSIANLQDNATTKNRKANRNKNVIAQLSEINIEEISLDKSR